MDAIGIREDDKFSRAFRTKLGIAQAINRLCQARPFSKISIDMISKEAAISNSSFYYHFSDKNEVVQWLSLLFYSNGIDQTGRTLTWFEGHLVTTKGFLQFKSLFTSAAECTDYGAGQPFFIRHRQKNLTETVTEYKQMELTNRIRLQIEALPYAEKVIANNYDKGHYDISLKEYCDIMVSLVPKDLFEALEEPAQHASAPGHFFT